MCNKPLLLVASLLLALTVNFGCGLPPAFGPPTTSHDLPSDDKSTMYAWKLEGVYAPQNDYSPMTSAHSSLLCVLGDTSYPPRTALNCLEAATGVLKWSRSIDNPSGIIVDESAAYVSYGGIGGVNAFDHDGNLRWRFVSSSNPVKYMFLHHNELQVALTKGSLVVLDATDGSRIQEIGGRRFLYREGHEIFALNYALDLRSLPDEGLVWESNLAGMDMYLPPIFTDQLVLIRTGRILGELVALERHSGVRRWTSVQRVISNAVIATTKNEAFALSAEGQLLQINLSTGTAAELTKFTNPPFLLNDEKVVGGYELALDEDRGTLFVLLGDSRQLFAISIR